MNNQNDVLNSIINQFFSELLIYLGVGGFIITIVIGIIIWYFFNQKVNRIEQTFTSELEKNRATDLDLIYRRREVYSRLIKSMRVFLQKADLSEVSSEEEKNEFLAAYDEMYIWAPDEVLEVLGKVIDLKRIWAKKKSEAEENGRQLEGTELIALQLKFRELHSDCLRKIREECGFIETEFKYRYVSF